MKKLLFVFTFLLAGKQFSQNNLQIIDTSAMSNNNMENNTGEIFVVYNFGGINFNKETTNEQESLLAEEKAGNIVYPNPVENILNYKLKEDFKFENVKVLDSNQKLLFYSNENNFQIDFSIFPVGLYIVIFNENQKNLFKIIKK